MKNYIKSMLFFNHPSYQYHFLAQISVSISLFLHNYSALEDWFNYKIKVLSFLLLLQRNSFLLVFILLFLMKHKELTNGRLVPWVKNNTHFFSIGRQKQEYIMYSMLKGTNMVGWTPSPKHIWALYLQKWKY
jgi:hypothetical protein